MNKCEKHSEIWKPIKEYEGLYEVSNLGRIKNNNKILKASRQNARKNSSYYRSVVRLIKNRQGKTFKVHRLVAEAFIPNPNNYEIINHIDGNPLNNNVNNLEWCTQKQNHKHAVETGLLINTINTIDRETMVNLLNNGYTYDDISNMLGIAKGTVFNYIRKFKIKKIYV